MLNGKMLVSKGYYILYDSTYKTLLNNIIENRLVLPGVTDGTVQVYGYKEIA